ncbi:MAG: hypothetical protein ACYDC6_07435 [Acidobacteriaceae bacterium]
MTFDNLLTLKDDMIAFIEGHGMRHFPALIPEETPRVWWNDPETFDGHPESSKESWKDFVEMAKAVGAPMVCIGEDVLEKDLLEFLIHELRAMSGTDAFEPETEKANTLLAQVGKLGHIELAFAHQGILFVHETATEWYKRYRELVDIIDHLQELFEDDYDNDDLDEEPE